MKLKIWALVAMHAVLWVGLGTWLLIWANTVHEMPFISIEGAVEQNLFIPVFAQFNATQTFEVQGTHSLSRIVIPLYVPEHSQQIKISLYDNDKLINWWKVPVHNDHSSGIVFTDLSFVSPVTVSGHASLHLDGSEIAYADSMQAPGFFIETQDASYPYGNYRIAENQKQGDMSVQFIEQKTNLQLYLENFNKDPFGRITFLAIICACLLVAAFAPSELLRLYKKRA